MARDVAVWVVGTTIAITTIEGIVVRGVTDPTHRRPHDVGFVAHNVHEGRAIVGIHDAVGDASFRAVTTGVYVPRADPGGLFVDAGECGAKKLTADDRRGVCGVAQIDSLPAEHHLGHPRSDGRIVTEEGVPDLKAEGFEARLGPRAGAAAAAAAIPVIAGVSLRAGDATTAAVVVVVFRFDAADARAFHLVGGTLTGSVIAPGTGHTVVPACAAVFHVAVEVDTT